MKDLYDGKDDPEEKKFLEYLKVSLDTVTFHTRKEKELDIGINVPEHERNARRRVESRGRRSKAPYMCKHLFQ